MGIIQVNKISVNLRGLIKGNIKIDIRATNGKPRGSVKTQTQTGNKFCFIQWALYKPTFFLDYMNKKEELFFKELILAEGIKSLYWNNKRYSKNDIIKIKQSFNQYTNSLFTFNPSYLAHTSTYNTVKN